MVSRSPTAHFLGLELATDQLRAAVVDEQLDLIGVEVVDFDSELAEFQTHGGIFTTPGDAYTTPVEMWIKALDLLLSKLSRNFELTKIKSIGGSAQQASVWWKASVPASLLRFTDPSRSIHDHLFITGSPFALPNTPVAQDTAALPQALALEHALGGPDAAAARLGTPAHASIAAAHALRIRETQPDIWLRAGRLQPASALLCSLLLGAWAPVAEAEATASGFWSHAQRKWDEGVLEVVSGASVSAATSAATSSSSPAAASVEGVTRLRTMLGEVDVHGGGRRVGTLAPYFTERFGFSADVSILPFTSDSLATYLSLCPASGDVVLSFGPMDTLLSPASQYVPHRLYTLFPHPAQEPNEKRRYVSMLMSRNGDVPRALVRDMYTKSWSAFDRLIAIVPPGGSIGLDDKLFSFWHLQAEAFPFSHVKGIFRFETGVKTNEFRDLRANPRCLIESQVLSFRVRYARMRNSPLYQTGSGSSASSSATQNANSASTTARNNGQQNGTGNNSSNSNSNSANAIAGPHLGFDPYSTIPLPRRIIATGAAANFPSIVNLLGDVLNAPIYIPLTQYESAHAFAPSSTAPGGVSSGDGGSQGQAQGANQSLGQGQGQGPMAQYAAAHRNAPAPGIPSRAALGGAYTARWVWGRERGTGTGAGSGAPSFEDEMRRLLARRWNLRAKVAMQHPGLVAAAAAAAAANAGGVGAGAHSPVPYLKHQRSGLGADVLMEEDEEEEGDDVQVSGAGAGVGVGVPAVATPPPRVRTTTSSSLSTATTTSSVLSPMGSGSGSILTSMTSPDGHGLGHGLGHGSVFGGMSPTGARTPTTDQQQQQQQQQQSQQTPGTSTSQGITPLTPVSALPMTNEASEAQLGWVKVAEPDVDAFMAYASIVPEFVRLEGMLIKSLV